MDATAPTLAILASALKIEHITDQSMQRAADNALRHLAADPTYDFDGSELRIISESETGAGVWIVTDGVGCSCKGGKHPMCKHRALFRLLLAREVLLDPLYVRTKILEQMEPAGYGEPPIDEDRVPAFAAPASRFPLNLPDDTEEWFGR